MKRFVIERIEENCVVLECENGSHVTIERKSLPKRIKDGDVLFFGEGSYFLDEKETEQRRRRIADLMKDVFAE